MFFISNNKRRLIIGVLLLLSSSVFAQSSYDTIPYDNMNSFVILNVQDYRFNKVINKGITTTAKQMDVIHVPIRWCRLFIWEHIKRHHFALNKGKRRVRKTVFRAVSFAYPSVSPDGEPIMLSGLVTIPILQDNKPERMLIYHRLLAPSYKIAPSNSLPIEAVITADNTICVFPDYYGSGITEGCPTPYTALNYHARCAVDCALSALEIVKNEGIELADGFYAWNTGYSQGGGYALATQRYIETELPDSLERLINLRWSLCGGGIYEPDKLFGHFITKGDMGSTPSIYFQALRGVINGQKQIGDSLSIRDFLSENAIRLGLDSILETPDDGFWDLAVKIDYLCDSTDPTDYFNPLISDTNSVLFKVLNEALVKDGCISDWSPQSTIILYHSENDQCVPFEHVLQAKDQLNRFDKCCFISTPPKNQSHFKTGFKYFSMLLRYDEKVIFDKMLKNTSQNNHKE